MRVIARLWALAAAFALIGWAAPAAEMPSMGTKNFTAPSETPSYFTNESGRATSRDGEASPADRTETDSAAPSRPVAASSPYATASQLGKHGAHVGRTKGRATRFAKAKGVKFAKAARGGRAAANTADTASANAGKKLGSAAVHGHGRHGPTTGMVAGTAKAQPGEQAGIKTTAKAAKAGTAKTGTAKPAKAAKRHIAALPALFGAPVAAI